MINYSKSIPYAFLIFILISTDLFGQNIVQKIKSEPIQDVNARFKLFRTDNMWTHLLLDSRNGRIWQVIYSVDKDNIRAKLPINTVMLIDNQYSRDGRFTLYQTDNMWNFILLDQDDGRVWQCQYSMQSNDYRYIIPIN